MRYFFGLVIMVAGVVLLLNNLGLTEVELGSLISTFWPLVLIYWGINLLFAPYKKSNSGMEKNMVTGEFVSGLILAGAGAVLLLKNLGWIEADLSFFWRLFWPAIIILVGISFLKGKSIGGKNHVAFMGGVEMGKSSAWNLKSDSYLAVMGGIDLNLTRANIPEGETVLDLTAIMGGIKIIVPVDLPVVCEGMAVLGGVDFLGEGTGGIVANKTISNKVTDQSNTLLRIQAWAFMGGIEVKRA